jgi:hypothetical protein
MTDQQIDRLWKTTPTAEVDARTNNIDNMLEAMARGDDPPTGEGDDDGDRVSWEHLIAVEVSKALELAFRAGFRAAEPQQGNP